MIKYNPKTFTLFKRGDDFKVIQGNYTRPEFVELIDAHWVLTEKVDGMSVVWTVTNDGMWYGGRTAKTQFTEAQTEFMQKTGEKIFLNAGYLFDQHESLEQLSVYAELCGPGIQGSGGWCPEYKAFVFDITANGLYMPYSRAFVTAGSLDMDIVPVLSMNSTMAGAVGLTKLGWDSLVGAPRPEGLVARTKTYLYDSQGNRVMWKLKLSDW